MIAERLFLPESWTADTERCQAAGIRAEQRSFTRQHDVAVEMMTHARQQNDFCISIPCSYHLGRDGVVSRRMVKAEHAPGILSAISRPGDRSLATLIALPPETALHSDA